MPGQSKEEQFDFLYKACGLSGFVVFLLIAILSLLLAIDIADYFTPFTIVSGVSLCIAIVFCVCISRGDSKQSCRRDRGNEPTFEEIELDERPVSRREDPRRLSIDYVRSLFNLPPARTDSDGSSKSEDDPDVQETIAMMKEKEAKQKLAATAGGDFSTSSEEESRILAAVADIHIGDETTESSDQLSTYSEEERRKIFRLTQLHFIDSEDSSSGIVETTEEIHLQESSPSDSNEEEDLTKKDDSAKET